MKPVLVAVFLLAVACFAVAAAPTAPDRPGIRFTVDERAVLDVLRAATPQTITVGNSLFSTNLTLLDPADLVLAQGRATFKIRVKGSTIPIDQVVTPVVTVNHDARSGQFYGTVSSLPLVIPGIGRVDLRDFLPRFEIPAVIENPWSLPDRALGLKVRIRRIAILDHQVEVGADVDLAPVPPTPSAALR